MKAKWTSWRQINSNHSSKWPLSHLRGTMPVLLEDIECPRRRKKLRSRVTFEYSLGFCTNVTFMSFVIFLFWNLSRQNSQGKWCCEYFPAACVAVYQFHFMIFIYVQLHLWCLFPKCNYSFFSWKNQSNLIEGFSYMVWIQILMLAAKEW